MTCVRRVDARTSAGLSLRDPTDATIGTMSFSAVTTWVAPAANSERGSPARSTPIRTGTPCSAPRRMSCGLSPTVTARRVQLRRRRWPPRHPVVVRRTLAAVVVGAEHDRERVPALLVEHPACALGARAGREHQPRAVRASSRSVVSASGIGHRRRLAVELVELAQEAVRGGDRVPGAQPERLEDLARRPPGKRRPVSASGHRARSRTRRPRSRTPPARHPSARACRRDRRSRSASSPRPG